jgi:uncharacterized protein (DUF2267 family)
MHVDLNAFLDNNNFNFRALAMKFAIKCPPSYRGLMTSTGYLVEVFLFWEEKGGGHMKTRKEFLEAVMTMANLKDLKQADDAARAVISLTKLIIGEELSQKIAEVSPPDLRQGWESIRAAQMDDYERDERLFETGETDEELETEKQWKITSEN